MEEEEVGVDGWLRRKEDEAALVQSLAKSASP
jgi:hypothetical protein